MTKVELHCAYMFDCPGCGRENFVRAVVVEMTPEEIDALVIRYGGEAADYATGRWMSRPISVPCQACNTEYEVEETEGDVEKEI